MYTITTEEFEIAREILRGLHLDVTDEDVHRHLDSDIITVNIGRNGEWHVWYQDDADCVCVRVSDRHELSEAEINEQFL